MATLSKAEESPSRIHADQSRSKNEKSHELPAARALLEEGRSSDSLPAGLVIRVGACLGVADSLASEHRAPEELKETWEFTSHHVHRVVIENVKGKNSYHRVESLPFDTKGICNDYLDGKAIEIQAKKGQGPEVGFMGTKYHLGWRFIELVWNEETILDLHENRAAGLCLYRESDARAFGALYDRLASQARVLFKPHSAEAD